MTKGVITTVFLSVRISKSNVAFSAHAPVPEPSVSRATWSHVPACGAQAACKLYASLRSVFFDGR